MWEVRFGDSCRKMIPAPEMGSRPRRCGLQSKISSTVGDGSLTCLYTSQLRKINFVKWSSACVYNIRFIGGHISTWYKYTFLRYLLAKRKILGTAPVELPDMGIHQPYLASASTERGWAGRHQKSRKKSCRRPKIHVHCTGLIRAISAQP
jgi:hypothetical protein